MNDFWKQKISRVVHLGLEESIMGLGTYIMLGCAFALGFVFGGIIIYAWNAKSWHIRDLDEILTRMGRVDTNIGKIHSNSKTMVARFGKFSEDVASDVHSLTANLTISGALQDKEMDFLTTKVMTKETAEDIVEYLDKKLDALLILGEELKERLKHL